MATFIEVKRMNQIIEVNIADVLIRLEGKIDKLDEKINKLSNDVAKLNGEISGLNKRVENLEFIARTVGGAIIIALLLALARYLFPNITL